jgi:hypothetical protein
MDNIIFVNGNIIFKSGDHQVKELIAFASDKWKSIAKVEYHVDFEVTNKDVLEPYCIYCASKEISTYGNNISGMQRPEDVIRIYREEINNLQRIRTQKIEGELVDAFNRQIYIGIIGTMELFLCDFLYCMVLGTKKYYKKYLEKSNQTYTLSQVTNSQWKTQKAVTNTILGTNYHKIGIVKSIYKNVLSIEFSKTDELEKLIKTRHNLVHRNGFPSKNSEYVKINEDMLDELILVVNNLINFIIDKKRIEIENWFPNP